MSHDLKKDIYINYLLALLVKEIIFFIIYLFKMGEKFTDSYNMRIHVFINLEYLFFYKKLNILNKIFMN